MKYWIESSFDHEDKEKRWAESLVVACDYGETGEETIGWLENSVVILSAEEINDLKEGITEILNRINSDIKNKDTK